MKKMTFGGGMGWGLIGGSRNQVIGGTIYAQSDGRSIAFYISEVTILNLDKEGCMASVTPTPRRDVWHHDPHPQDGWMAPVTPTHRRDVWHL